MLKNIIKKPERLKFWFSAPPWEFPKNILPVRRWQDNGGNHRQVVTRPCHIRYVCSPCGKVYSCCSCFLSPSDSTATLQSKLYFLVDFQKVCFHESFPEMLRRDEGWGIRATNKGYFILKVYSYIKDIRQQQIRHGYCSKSDIGRPFLIIGPLYCV